MPSGLPSIATPLGRAPPRFRDVAVLSFVALCAGMNPTPNFAAEERFPAQVALTETLAMGRALAARAGQPLDTNQEIAAVGAANVAGSFFQSYTVAGSFSRSAVNVVTGGSSQLSSIVTAGAVVGALLFFTGLFTHVPKPVLASILIFAVSGLIDSARVKALWGAGDALGLAKWCAYFSLMMALGPAEGLIVAVAVDLVSGRLEKALA